MTKPFISIAIAEDHTIFRKALKGFLTQHRDIQVVVEASNGTELLEALKNNTVDILLTDICMPEMNGEEAIKKIRAAYPDLRIIVVSMQTDIETVNNLLDDGIFAYISKAEEPETLIQAILSARDNRIYKNQLFTDALLCQKRQDARNPRKDRIVQLEDREKKILQLLWDDKNNKEIADEVFLGIRSIEKIRQEMKEKLGVKSTIGLLKYGLNNNIIDTGHKIAV